MPEASVGVIGGSGLYDIEALTDIESVAIDTPWQPQRHDYRGDARWWGWRSSHGTARHQPAASCRPSERVGDEITGVTHLISVSAGSLREEPNPVTS